MRVYDRQGDGLSLLLVKNLADDNSLFKKVILRCTTTNVSGKFFGEQRR